MVKQLDIWKAIEKLNYNPRKTLQFFKILRRDTIRSRRDTKMKKTQIKKKKKNNNNNNKLKMLVVIFHHLIIQ